MPAQGHVLVSPTSVTKVGTTATLGANGKVTFSGVSSLTVNGAFDSDFHNYLIVAQYLASGVMNITMTLRDSEGATPADATTNYIYQSVTSDGINITGNRFSATPSFAVGTVAGTLTCGSLIYVNRPYVPEQTSVRVITSSDQNSSTIYNYSGAHSTASPYDGFTIATSTGTISGSLTVYGVRK